MHAALMLAAAVMCHVDNCVLSGGGEQFIWGSRLAMRRTITNWQLPYAFPNLDELAFEKISVFYLFRLGLRWLIWTFYPCCTFWVRSTWPWEFKVKVRNLLGHPEPEDTSWAESDSSFGVLLVNVSPLQFVQTLSQVHNLSTICPAYV